MTRRNPEGRLLCYASIFALSLAGCSQHGGKTKGPPGAMSGSDQAVAVLSGQGSRYGKSGGKWFRKKHGSLASRSGSNKGSSNYDSLWDRLFDLYDLPPVDHPDVDRELSWFASHPSFLDRAQGRAEPFLYSIVKQVEKHDIPGELALLPVIESAFQPHAVSPANAAGIWQFIPSTGRIYGLKRSQSYDGRRDVYASTRAAIKYLKKLHSEFGGDWLLAIAAYNCGEGAVSRAVQRNYARGLPTDFWSLDLPSETRSYVPRLLAVSRLLAEADRYGIALHEIPNSARYKPVKVNAQVDLAMAAHAADISLAQFQELNPGFRGQFADVEGSYHLFIPASKKTSEFKQKLDRLAFGGASSAFDRFDPMPLAPSPYANALNVAESAFTPVADPNLDGDRAQRETEARAQEERVLARERARERQLRAEAEAREIAAAHERELREKEEARARLLAEERQAREQAAREAAEAEARAKDLALEQERQRLVQEEAQAAEREAVVFSESTRSARHRAQGRKRGQDRGQSPETSLALSGDQDRVAAKGRSALSSRKGDPKPDRANERPIIDVQSSDEKSAGKKGKHVVQPGETLWAVARKHAVDVGQLAEWNKFSARTEVKTGQVLVIWSKDAAKKLPAVNSVSRPLQSSSKYTVREGDTLFSISRRFKVSMAELRKWNGSDVAKQVQVGRNIKVQMAKD